MKTQNFKNHRQIVPGHAISFFIISPLCIVLASINIFREQNLTSLLFLLISILLLLAFLYMRTFALKVQDRAIRAEENLRHFALTGKLLDKNLKKSQIIALRFAEDEEFLLLIEKSLKDNLSSKEIKQEIKNWKADYSRA